MKLLVSLLIICSIMSACNNSERKIGDVDPLTVESDSLKKQVLDGHDVAMGKMGKLMRAKNEVDRLLDSMAKAGSKLQQPMRARLDSLKADLEYADFAMNKWMSELHIDTFSNDVKSRIKYFTNENEKVTKVKENVLMSLAKADSLLRKKL